MTVLPGPSGCASSPAAPSRGRCWPCAPPTSWSISTSSAFQRSGTCIRKKSDPACAQAIADARKEGFERIFIGYAECGTQGELDKICAEEGIARLEGPHCYSFFTGNEKFLAGTQTEFTAFYLTDFLARQFEAFVIEPLKLDKHPEIRDMVFGNYTKIVYLAQNEDAELQKKARWAADYLGLDYEYRFTGYGDLSAALRLA